MTDKMAIPILLSACLAAPAWAAGGVMLRDDSLRASASAGAALVAKAAKGSKVEILARQGGWTQIKADGKTGWVHLLSVRSDQPGGGGGGDLAGVAALAEKRDPNKVVATAGLRGLNEEELRKAQYSPQEMQKLEGLAVTGETARRFATEGSLKPQRLDYLPAPKRKESQAAPSGGLEL
jgi:hypothetical protein